jgi:hypothetical protein
MVKNIKVRHLNSKEKEIANGGPRYTDPKRVYCRKPGKVCSTVRYAVQSTV